MSQERFENYVKNIYPGRVKELARNLESIINKLDNAIANKNEKEIGKEIASFREAVKKFTSTTIMHIEFHKWEDFFTEEIYNAIRIKTLVHDLKTINPRVGRIFTIIFLKGQEDV